VVIVLFCFKHLQEEAKSIEMVGIVAYGAHVPFWRLSRESISPGAKGEKAIANFDEDSITMAVSATLNCLGGMDRESIDRLYFASTTSPYKEKQASSFVAAACDLPRHLVTTDFSNSLKGGTSALMSAADAVGAKTAKRVIVSAADCRLGAPGSEFEMNCGDGGAALLLGDTDVVASIEGSYSVSDQIMDVWRTQNDRFIRSWETRFAITEGYMKVTAEAVAGLLSKCSMSPKDFAKVVFYAPDQRSPMGLAKTLGFDPSTQLQDTLVGQIGNTGTPHVLLLLIAALEQAQPGDRILMAGYGDGADAFVFKVTDAIKDLKKESGLSAQLSAKQMINDYRTYLLWRGFLNPDSERVYVETLESTSVPAMWRERNRILNFHGSQCKNCGTVQVPPQRVCISCHAKDQSDEVRMSDKKGTVFTFSMDAVSSKVDSPVVIPIVDFEGGGRGEFYMTDRMPEEIKIGMSTEMTFRKLFFAEGIYHYNWKAMPVRIRNK